jgi:hypothetical protein
VLEQCIIRILCGDDAVPPVVLDICAAVLAALLARAGLTGQDGNMRRLHFIGAVLKNMGDLQDDATNTLATKQCHHCVAAKCSRSHSKSARNCSHVALDLQ